MIADLYARKASTYDWVMKQARYSSTIRAILRMLSARMRPDARILDLGCGTGLGIAALVHRFPACNIVGVDCSREMLEICREKFPEARLLVGDFNKGGKFRDLRTGGRAGLRRGAFDLVISTGAVSEYGTLERVIPMIHRLTRKKGLFINVGIKRNLLNRMFGRVWGFRPKGKHALILACRTCGFRDVQSVNLPWRLFPTNLLKFVVTARKR